MAAWTGRLEPFIASTAIFTLPGNTPTSSAALARPAARRVDGISIPTAQSSSATPDPRMTSLCAGTHEGISGSNTLGLDEVHRARCEEGADDDLGVGAE